MKRLLVLLLLLAIMGGTVFFFGWVQLQIPAGSYGVIFTKTNGWEPSVVEPGTFTWRWQRLIPTNLTLYLYPDTRRQFTVRSSGALPGADSLAVLVDDSGAFTYSARALVTIRVEPSALPRLAEENNLRPEQLGAFFDQVEAHAAELTTRALDQVLGEPGDGAGTRISEISDAIRARLSDRVDDVTVVSVAITELSLPDTETYEQARTLLGEVMQARATALQVAAEGLAEQQTADEAELSRLERYGQILDQYPVLLEYFRVSSDIGANPLDIESLLDEPGE